MNGALVPFLVATSFAAGLNVYLTVATLGLLARAGLVELPAPCERREAVRWPHVRGSRARPMPFGYAARVACTRFPLDVLPWARGGHPLERKKVGGHPGVALLEFAPGFADPNWCRRAHVVYVLRGVLTFELETGLVQIARGESCVIDPGTAHRAENRGTEPVVMFIVSDLFAMARA